MKLVEAREKLSQFDLSLITLKEVCSILQLEKSHASQITRRLTEAKALIKIRRGLWAWPQTDPLSIPTYLTSPSPCYLSLQTALFLHGVIDQIPAYYYAITLARKQETHSPKGVFSIHHIDSHFFYGYETHYQPYYQIASPEKALLDYFYLSIVEPTLFGSLPELDSDKLNIKKGYELIQKLEKNHAKTQSFLKQRWDDVFN